MSRKREAKERAVPATYADYEPPPRRRGCWFGVLVMVLFAVGTGGIVAVLLTLVGEPGEIRVSAALDRDTVPPNETFTLTVEVENVDLDPVTLKAVGLDADLLGGATVTSVDAAAGDPAERSYPLLGDWTEYPLDRALRGGDKLAITITLVAATPGVYSGDVSVWVEGDLLGISTSRARRAAVEFDVQ